MKSILKYIAGTILASFVIAACNEDDGNYNYLTEAELKAQLIEIDTTGLDKKERDAFLYTHNSVGDTLRMSPRVKYPYKEDLKCSWIVYPYQYKAIEVGNTTMYPKPDTICRHLELEWVVDLEPDWYTCHLIVQDTVRGLSATMQMGGYFYVDKPGERFGFFVLSEYDGQTDIDYYSSELGLIYEGDVTEPHYYSQGLGKGMLAGKPRFMSLGSDYIYVATDENMYRLNYAGLELMETFDEMFYQTPNFDPQMMYYVNNCEFLINDGKLHVLYTNKGNDRKFSAPISGDYTAGNYLSDETRTTWRPTTGAINADQIIFDEENLKFRPYFPYGTEISEFGATTAGAFVDANKVPAKPLAMGGGVGGKTYAIIVNPENNKPYLYIYNFFNVVDDGDLSANGANSVIDLSGCEDIKNLKYFTGHNLGEAFYYATDKAAYSFSPSTGQTTSEKIYTCEGEEEITCLSVYCSHGGGGWPTAGYALWLGIWEESKKEGKIMEFEIDPDYGIPYADWSPMFGHDNPYITTGYGKIKSIINYE